MDAGHEAPVAQVVEVLADGLRRHVETPGEVVDEHAAALAGEAEKLDLPARQALHGRASPSWHAEHAGVHLRRGTAQLTGSFGCSFAPIPLSFAQPAAVKTRPGGS